MIFDRGVPDILSYLTFCGQRGPLQRPRLADALLRFSRKTPNGRRPAPRPPRRPAPSCARSTPPSDTTNHGAAAHRHCNTRRLCLCAAGQLTVFARCRGETAEADKSRGSSGLSLPDTHGLKRTFAPLQACCNTAYQTLHSPQVQDRCHSKE